MSNIGECGLDVGTRHAVPAFWFGDLAVKSLSWSGDHERTKNYLFSPVSRVRSLPVGPSEVIDCPVSFG